jgi:hypothetical protein
MDMTPLMNDATIDPIVFMGGFIQRFANDVQERVGRMSLKVLETESSSERREDRKN